MHSTNLEVSESVVTEQSVSAKVLDQLWRHVQLVGNVVLTTSKNRLLIVVHLSVTA
jgi:hypothetical protein